MQYEIIKKAYSYNCDLSCVAVTWQALQMQQYQRQIGAAAFYTIINTLVTQ